MSTPTSPREIEWTFDECFGKWKGCDWVTKFGKTGLNLRAVKSSHALLMARATSGQEKTDWHAAVTWLKEIERRANDAAYEAELAMRYFNSGRLNDAVQHAKLACEIEEQFHPDPIWAVFKNAIEKAAADQCAA